MPAHLLLLLLLICLIAGGLSTHYLPRLGSLLRRLPKALPEWADDPLDPFPDLAQLAVAMLRDTRPAAVRRLGREPVDALRPLIEAVLSEEAAQQWLRRQEKEMGIRSADFRNGMHMEMQPAREMLAHFVAAARTMLGDAPNYTETKLEMDVKVAEVPAMYTIVIQRHGPGVLTPHDARLRAEAYAGWLAAAIQEGLDVLADDDTQRARHLLAQALVSRPTLTPTPAENRDSRPSSFTRTPTDR
ncbi:hypothetical protein AB0M58_13815 [Streptomyces bobili]|uniref:hypothetical protein n=1 Tax=Streptomyces bobili TaxID=67280 RepID=UPI003411F979